jgi:hypothetical protein
MSWRQQNKSALTRKKFSQAASSFRVGGDHYEFPVRVQGNRASVQAQASDSALGTPQRQVEKKFQVADRMYTGVIRLFAKDIKNAEGNDRAFVSHLDDEVNSMLEDMLKCINIETFGDGTGTLATCASGTASATQTLTVGTSFGQWGSRYLAVGDFIDIYDSTLVTSRTSGAGVTVNTITRSSAGGSATVVLSGSVTTTTGDIVVRGKAGPNNAYIGLWSGTNNDTGTFQGLSRSTYGILKGAEVGAGGNPVSEALLSQVLSLVEINGGQTPEEFRTGQAQFDAYAALGYAQKRFMDAKLDKGFQSLDFNGIPFVKDVDCPPAAIFALNYKFIQMGLLGPMDWMKEDGDVLKWDAGFAAYKAVLLEAGNYCYTRPNALGRIDGLAVANFYQQ